MWHMKHEERSWLKWQAKHAEKFSSGLIDHASWWVKGIHVRLEFGRWNPGMEYVVVHVATALQFSQTLHLDALELYGMVFERCY